MKKFILTLVAAFSLLNFASAENMGFQVGAGADVNLFLYNGATTSYNPSVLSGFHVYGSYEYKVNKYIGLSAGLRFSQIGLLEHNAVTYNNEVNDRSWKKSFLEIPLHFVTHIWKGVFVSVGPVGEFGLSYTMKDVRKSGGSVVSTETTYLFSTPKYEYKTVYPRANLCVEAQMGYDFSHVRLYAGYKYDFFNVYQRKDNTCKMMQIQLGAAFRF